MKKITCLLMAMFMLTISFTYGQTVTKTFTPPSPISVDGCGTYCNTLPGVTFTASDFPLGCIISDVDISITWLKTDGTCVTPDIFCSFHEETNFRLDGPAAQVILAIPNTWSGCVDSPQVTTVFDQAAGGIPSGTPVSGTFLPNNGNLDSFNGLNALGTWNLSAGDTAGSDPLCISSYSVTITVAPNNPPIITCPMDFIADTNPGFCDTIILFSATAFDIEDGVLTTVQTLGLPSGSAFPLGLHTIEFTATDSCGATSTCTFTITIIDNEPPNAVCQNITVQLDASGNASIIPGDVDGGSTDNCGIASLAIDIDTFDCNDVGSPVTVTLTVTDTSGNTDTCTAIVTVEDNIAPIAICQDITVQLDATGNASITGADIDNGSSDACGIDTLVASPNTFDCSDVGFPVTVTLTVTDVNGNVSTCTATVTVEDNVSPVAICQDITVQLDVTGNASITGADIDNGSSDACGIDTLVVSPNTFDCSDVGTPVTVTLTVTDVNGNVSTCTATVTVEDNVPPVAICQDITVQLDATGNVSIVAADVDGGSTDACGIASLSIDIMDFTCADIGPNNVTLTVTDVNGNVSTCVAVVTVEDNIPPVISCPLDIITDTDPGVCFAVVFFADAIALDNCAVTVAQTGGLSSGSQFPVGVSTIEFTATDEGGNTAVCSFTITVIDNEPAMAVCQNITIQLDANGDASIVAADVNGGSTDNCGIASMTVSPNTFDCSDVGPNNVTLTVTDVNGNVSTCIAVVTVEDVTPPDVVCMDITVQLDANGTVTISGIDVDGGSTDACGIASYDLDIDTFDCSDVGDNTVVLTVTDVNGNVSTCTAVVTVEDVTSPILICMDITLELGADGTASIIPDDVIDTLTDACGIDTTTIDIFDFDCSDVGTPVTVTVFAIDVNGNLSMCTAIVTVVDLMGPEITCPPDQTVDPGISNLFYIVPDYWANGDATATDNCTDPVVITSQNPAPGTLLPDGVYTITITAEDEFGNISTCTFELTVESILGVGDNDLNIESIVMYPNPAVEYVILSNPKSLALDKAVIYDLNGRLIQTIALTNMGTEISIDVSQLSSATYIVLINGENLYITKQLIKE